MKLFGNRKGAEHIAARKTEKKTGGLKRWQRVTIIVAAIVLVLGGTALAVYKVNVKPPVKQPEPVETEPLPEEETVKKPTVYVPATEVDEETGEETEVETEVPASHRAGVYNILIAGTDEGGYRTDTMMLFSVDREAKTMSLVSIPRDTLVYCEYSVPKLNSAYGWAGGGDDGMQELLTRVEEIVGFRPDGYVVTDLACFEELVDLMGGVTFDVPVEMHYSDPSQNLYIDLSAGEQKLDGAQAMQVMRFRSGYADADLGRVKVQRDFLAAALPQWASVKNAYKLPSAIRLITEHTKTDLTSAQLAWLAESAALCGTDGLTMATMPGSAAWIGGGSYYVLDAAQVADLVNEKLNPYQKEVTVVDLAIRAG